MTAPDTTSLITGVDFVAQLVTDFDRAVAFYGETLGLHRSAHVPDRGFAEFETGNLTLSLIDPAKMGWSTAPVTTPSRCTSTTSRRRGRRSRSAACSSTATRSTPAC